MTPGLTLTLWDANGLGAALASSRALLADARPPGVQLHAGPQGLIADVGRAADEVRRLVPGVALAAGVAWDGWIEDYDRATAARQAEVERLYLRAVKAAHGAGVGLLVINSEAKGKTYPRAARLLGARLIDQVRATCPGLQLGHTSFDHPHYHPEERDNGGRIDADDEGYPWSVYLGGAAARAVAGLVLPNSGRVDVAMPQVYAAPAAPEDGAQRPIAPRGALAARLASHRRSWARAVALGWIDAAAPVVPYVQLHHVDARDTAALGAVEPSLAGWAASSRLDDHGRAAVRALCAARRGELTLSGLTGLDLAAAVAWAQSRLGLTADGAWGPRSRAACAAWQSAHGLPATGELTADTLAALGR